MKKYVAGLMFSSDSKYVALIIKNKPDWQKGLLNGIGGKIEEEDIKFSLQHNLITDSQLAMIREFEEETGVTTEPNDWQLFLIMGNEKGNSDTGERQTQQYSEGWSVDFYKCFSDEIWNAKTTTDEVVVRVPVDELLSLNTIDNLKWIILLALDKNPKITKSEY